MQKQAAVKYSDGKFQPVIEDCQGCERIVEEDGSQFCRTYLFPKAKWKRGICNFATHKKPEIKVTNIKVNPLKAAKRASASKK
ncbi:MAG: PxxKW family cysteine-rich protein [Desulfopila sp.]